MTVTALGSLMEVFSVLGKRVELFAGSKFEFYLVPHWPTPSFSPLVLIPHEKLAAGDLKRLERYFSEHPTSNPVVNSAPYFTFLKGEDLYDLSNLESVCDNAGWVKEDDPLAINLMLGAIDNRLPRDLQIDVTTFGKPGLPEDYKELLREGFDADDHYLVHVESAYRAADAATYIVLIHNGADSVIAGGTVSVRASFGFFTWGAVHKEHRGQGFHSMLVGACRSVAAKAGARVSAITTRNMRVRGRCDQLLELYICRKNPEQGEG